MINPLVKFKYVQIYLFWGVIHFCGHISRNGIIINSSVQKKNP